MIWLAVALFAGLYGLVAYKCWVLSKMIAEDERLINERYNGGDHK